MSEPTHRQLMLSTGRMEERARRTARWLAAFIERKGTTAEYLASMLSVDVKEVVQFQEKAKTDSWDNFVPLSWENRFDTMGKRAWIKGKLHNEKDLDTPFYLRKKEHELAKAERKKKERRENNKRRAPPKKNWRGDVSNRAIHAINALAQKHGIRPVKVPEEPIVPAPQEERASFKIVSGVNVSQDANGTIIFSAYSNIPIQSASLPFRFEHTFNFNGLEPLKK